MTAQQFELVKKTWKLLRGVDPALLGAVFYGQLFIRFPMLRALFKTDMDSQYQKFVDMLTLQLRLLRDVRAFLDPELQSGKKTAAEAYFVLESDVLLSHAFAKEEVERFTYRSPGQANSYFYGYTKLLQLRKDAEAALGPKFNAKRFHDFLLAQGLLPPDLMRQAVMEDFVPGQKKAR